MTSLLITIIPLLAPVVVILLTFAVTILIVRKKERRYKRANPGPDKTAKEQKG